MWYNAYMNLYITIEEASELLSVSQETIKRYIEKGDLPIYKLERSVRLLPDDVISLMRQQIMLTPGVRAAVRSAVPDSENVDMWRIQIQFVDKDGAVIGFGKTHDCHIFTVWVAGDYLKDIEGMEVSQKNAERVGLAQAAEVFDSTIDSNGDRSLNRINTQEFALAFGRKKEGTPYSAIEVGNNIIRFATEGFVMPGVIAGSILVLSVENEGSKTYIAFAESLLNAFTNERQGASRLVRDALDTTIELLRDNTVFDSTHKTFERYGQDFVERTDPEWKAEWLLKYFA